MNKSNFKIEKKEDYFEIKDLKKNIHILAKEYYFGRNIVWGRDIKICNSDSGPMEKIVIGDNVFVDHSTTIMLPDLSVMDYTKINNHFYAHGNNPLSIGYNCWFGRLVILDTLGGLTIGNNVGVGSHCQIYSHAKFGDTLYGCRINSFIPVSIGDDVWIAPNSVITSASMAEKSMLLAGGVLNKSTEKNHIYAGVPTQDITDKIGNQFVTTLDYSKIFDEMNRCLKEFYSNNENFRKLNSIKIVMEVPEDKKTKYTYFVVKERRYIKRSTDEEVAFMKFLLPDKAKFIPYQIK